MSKDTRRMMLKLMLLHKISKKPCYSYGLIEEFSSHPKAAHLLNKNGKELKNDIYNTIKALEKSGYIKPKAKIEGGKLKNYYYITKEGREVLKETKRLFIGAITELVKVIG